MLVAEQELFSFDIEYACEYNHRHIKEVREIISLLQYAPKMTIENIRNQLLRYKTLHDETRVRDTAIHRYPLICDDYKRSNNIYSNILINHLTKCTFDKLISASCTQTTPSTIS